VGPKAPRQRVKWTRELDEIVRDASAIITVRCMDQRIDWGALEILFPTLSRNQVRQRAANLKQSAAAYTRRLEEKWHELWIIHRGTPVLPDPKPESASKFPIVEHIEFLRRHVDKNSLYVF
jgi:oxalate---CoA ligase